MKGKIIKVKNAAKYSITRYAVREENIIGEIAEKKEKFIDSPIESMEFLANPWSEVGVIPDNAWNILYDFSGFEVKINYKDGTSEVVTVAEHEYRVKIGKYKLWLHSYFDSDDDENRTGKIYIEYQDASAFFQSTILTYASLLKNAEAMLPGRPISISLNPAATYRIFRFIPLETKEYEISSTGTFDTLVELLPVH